MDDQNNNKPNTLTIAVGVLLLIGGLYGFARGISTTKWPSTTGEVLYSGVTQQYVRHDNSYDYSSSIEYSYSVNGIKYNSWIIQRGLGEFLQNTELLYALFTTHKYSKGTQLTVYYKGRGPLVVEIE